MSSCCFSSTIKPAWEWHQAKLYHIPGHRAQTLCVCHQRSQNPVAFLKDMTFLYERKMPFLKYCGLFDYGNYHHMFFCFHLLLAAALFLHVRVWRLLVLNRKQSHSQQHLPERRFHTDDKRILEKLFSSRLTELNVDRCLNSLLRHNELSYIAL